MTTSTLTLTDFLLARIAEDEDDPWRGAELIGADRLVGQAEHDAFKADEVEWVARVLAECEAKRRIVERHYTTGDDAMESGICGEDDFRAPCPTLRLLALPYAHHPDFREEWRS